MLEERRLGEGVQDFRISGPWLIVARSILYLKVFHYDVVLLLL